MICIMNIWKETMSLDTVFPAQAQYFFQNFGSLLTRQASQTMNYSFDNNNSSLLLQPSPKLTILVNQLNDNTPDDNDKDTANFIHCKYFEIDEI